ncbi:MAG: hypothetical protein ACJATT_003611 [Myxococcota bacterium]
MMRLIVPHYSGPDEMLRGVPSDWHRNRRSELAIFLKKCWVSGCPGQSVETPGPFATYVQQCESTGPLQN